MVPILPNICSHFKNGGDSTSTIDDRKYRYCALLWPSRFSLIQSESGSGVVLVWSIGWEIVKNIWSWLAKKKSSRLTSKEREILEGASETEGYVVLVPVDGSLSLVRTGARSFGNVDNQSELAEYLDAVDSLETKHYLKRETDKALRITSHGIKSLGKSPERRSSDRKRSRS